MRNIKVILCCDNNYGIGKKNSLPWNIPKEMNIFKKKTIGNENNCVIMGKNTFLSIPKKFRPLQKRHNCILTSLDQFTNKNITILNDLNKLKKWITETNYDEYWIIGGEKLYKSVLQEFYIDEIHLSILDNNYDCDCFFPKESLKPFKKIEETYDKNNRFTHIIFKNQNKDCL